MADTTYGEARQFDLDTGGGSDYVEVNALVFAASGGSNLVGGVLESGSSAIGALAVGGATPHDSVDSGNPVKIGGKARSIAPSAVAGGDRVDAIFDTYGYMGVAVGRITSAVDAHPNTTIGFVNDAPTSGSGPLAGANYLYNGTTWDRMRSGGVTGMVGVAGSTAADAAIAAYPVTVGGRASAATPTAMSADGDVVNAWFTTRGALNTRLVDANGDPLSVGGGTQYTEDVALGATPIGTLAIGVGSSAIPTAASADGDAIGLWASREGALNVILRDTSGVAVSAATQYAEDAALGTSGTGTLVLARRDDALSTLTPVADDAVGLRVGDKGALWVQISDGSGNQITSFGGGVQYVGDAAATATPTGTIAMGLANATVPSAVSADNDAVAPWFLRNGIQNVRLVDNTGTALSVGGGTQYTEDTAITANAGIGNLMIARRDDALSTLTPVENDAVGLRVSSEGALWVKLYAAEVAGDMAHDSADSGNPVKIGAKASSGTPTGVASGDRVNLWADTFGLLQASPFTGSSQSMSDGYSNSSITGVRYTEGGGAIAGLTVRAMGFVYNGSTWDRRRSAVGANVADLAEAGVPAAGVGPGFARVNTGSLTAQNHNVVMNMQGAGNVLISVTGTWTGTLSAQLSFDGGSTYVDVNTIAMSPWLMDLGSGTWLWQLTANGNYTFQNLHGCTHLKLNMGAGPTGTCVVRMVGQVNAGRFWVTGDVNHDNVDTNAPVKIGGRASAAIPSAVSADGDRVNAWFTTRGALNARLVDANGDPLSVGGGTQYAGDAAATSTPTGTMGMGLAKATVPSDVSADNDAVAAWFLRNGIQNVRLVDGSGTALSVGGGTQYTEDAAITANAGIGNLMIGRRDDALSTLTPIEGDAVGLRVGDKGALWVQISDGAGAQITSFGGGTQYAEDAALGTNPTGTLSIGVGSSAIPTAVSADGDAVGLWASKEGALNVILRDTSGVAVSAATQYAEDAALGASGTGTLMLARRDDALSTLTPVEDDTVGLRVNSRGALWAVPEFTQIVSGSMGALNATVVVPAGGAQQIGFAITGTWSGTITFQLSFDGGSTYTSTSSLYAVSPLHMSTGVAASAVTANTSMSWWNHKGASHFRFQMTSYTSGTANVIAHATPSVGGISVIGADGGSVYAPFTTSDGYSTTASGFLTTLAAGYVFNGSTWDRARSGGVTGMLGIAGAIAADSPISTLNPVVGGARASTAQPTAMSADGDVVNLWANRQGALVPVAAPHVGLLGSPWTLASKTAQYSSTQTSAVLQAGAAGETIVVTKVQIQAGGTTAGTMQLYFGTGAYSRGTSRAIFDGEFAPSATLKPGVVMDGPFIAGAAGDDVLVTTSAAINPLTITIWFYLVT